METVLRSYQYTLIIYSSTDSMTDVDLLHLASDLGDVLLEGVAGLESSKLLFDSLESIKMGCYLSQNISPVFFPNWPTSLMTVSGFLYFRRWTHLARTLLKLFNAGSQKTSSKLSLLLEVVDGERRSESKAEELQDGQRLATVFGDCV